MWLFKSCPLDKYALSWTTFVQSNLVQIKFYPVDKYDRHLKLQYTFVVVYSISKIVFPLSGNRLHITGTKINRDILNTNLIK